MTHILLGDLFELKYGKSLRKDTRIEGSVPVYGSNGQVDVHSESLVGHPTIIVGRKGSIGEVHLVKTPCWPIDTTYFVEPISKQEFNLDWLYRLLRTLRLQELNRSAAIPGLNREDVYRIPILLPPIDDQIRIAHLLGKVEALITQRKQHLQQLDDLLKSAFLEMFGDPVRNEKGWETSTIDGFCDAVFDCPHSTPEYSEGKTAYYCIRSSDIVEGYLDLSKTYQVDEQVFKDRIARYRPQANDIVYSREGGRLGNAARIISSEPVCLGQRMMLFKVSEANKPEFLWALLESVQFKSKLQSLIGGGAAPRVNIKDLKKLVVIKPDPDVQLSFSKLVLRIDGLRGRYEQHLKLLEALYGTLTQQAFKGALSLSRVLLPVNPATKFPDGMEALAVQNPENYTLMPV